MESKLAQRKFDSVGEQRTSRKLELIHSDVYGPMQTNSLGGKRYFVTFIDDFSECAAVFFISHKSEVLVHSEPDESSVENAQEPGTDNRARRE